MAGKNTYKDIEKQINAAIQNGDNESLSKLITDNKSLFEGKSAPSGWSNKNFGLWSEAKDYAVTNGLLGSGTEKPVVNNASATANVNEPAGESAVNDNSWQDRIKNGKATDEDMANAYQAYKNGQYTPGAQTEAYFKEHFENNPVDEVKAQKDAIVTQNPDELKNKGYSGMQAMLDNAIASSSKAGDYEAYKQGKLDKLNPQPTGEYDMTVANDAKDPLGNFSNYSDQALYDAQQDNKNKGESSKMTIGVDGNKGKIKKATLGDIWDEKEDAENAYQSAIDADPEVQVFQKAKDLRTNAASIAEQKQQEKADAYKQLQQNSNRITEIGNKENQYGIRSEQGLIDQYNQKKSELADLENQLADAQKLESSSEQKADNYQNIADDTRDAWFANAKPGESSGNVVNTIIGWGLNNSKEQQDMAKHAGIATQRINEQISLLNQEIEKLGPVNTEGLTPEEIQERNDLLSQNTELANKTVECAEGIIQLNNTNLDIVNNAVMTYGTDAQKAGLQYIEGANESVNNLFNGGANKQDISNTYNEIAKLDEYINNEIANDPTIRASEDEKEWAINEFEYYSLDCLKTAFVVFLGIAAGDIGVVYNALNNSALSQRNRAYSEAETKYKTDALNAYSQNNVKNTTASTDAAYTTKQAEPIIAQAIANGQINSQQGADAIKSIALAHQEYVNHVNNGGDPGFATWYATQNPNIGWVSMLGQLMSNPTIANAIKGLFESSDLGSDENMKEDIVNVDKPANSMINTKGKTAGWINNAVNKASQPKPSQETDFNSEILASKQNIVNQGLQNKAQQAQQPQQKGNAQPQPNKGWGTTQQ